MRRKGITAAVAIGSNLGDTYGYLLDAEKHLLALRGSENFRFSPIYRTVAVDSAGSPDYLNAAVAFETSLEPGELLSELLGIEARNGRERPFRNAPRTLDLDLLLYGEELISEPALIVPHPRLHERFFALTPLCDLLPDAMHPGLGTTIRALERRLGELHAKDACASRCELTFMSNRAG
ncbi:MULTISPECIES: 2-amino-4-hydroxy-6-hydroxymethyldihydropteridine diphosphokinase [Sorangium]|uniref:2-amino-4-hydroxy-6-hydroxymethyldihydropteridine pyrophosphokinase n=1 Tax=Sorangium cellulosum TaxID=56 RepID=A0A4P2QQC7_SORCE|nr:MULTISPECIES: 2-amino-4-hydroxy-6-hydroxymethyldihydropteridine diphosphokinase [Sorangium]AUX32345.1 2-amino-4-hydroxy-6- hydroxymethyldihydropteridine pyrophosphokinase [Sorangium cellulosum]WCQ91719.1 2-amino-4-hydroxy-6-hydroxymethyldihydropteridine pyrophosphokinase [Sorangium sp. Soce836]